MTWILVMLGAYIIYSRTRSFGGLGMFVLAALFITTTIQMLATPYSADEAVAVVVYDFVLIAIWTAAGYGFFHLKQHFSPLVPRDEAKDMTGKE